MSLASLETVDRGWPPWAFLLVEKFDTRLIAFWEQWWSTQYMLESSTFLNCKHACVSFMNFKVRAIRYVLLLAIAIAQKADICDAILLRITACEVLVHCTIPTGWRWKRIQNCDFGRSGDWFSSDATQWCICDPLWSTLSRGIGFRDCCFDCRFDLFWQQDSVLMSMSKERKYLRYQRSGRWHLWWWASVVAVMILATFVDIVESLGRCWETIPPRRWRESQGRGVIEGIIIILVTQLSNNIHYYNVGQVEVPMLGRNLVE